MTNENLMLMNTVNAHKIRSNVAVINFDSFSFHEAKINYTICES